MCDSMISTVALVPGTPIGIYEITIELSSTVNPYFHVTSIPKKCMKTARFGLFFGFCCGLRM